MTEAGIRIPPHKAIPGASLTMSAVTGYLIGDVTLQDT
jgi:hypothetical protein